MEGGGGGRELRGRELQDEGNWKGIEGGVGRERAVGTGRPELEEGV